MFGKRGAGAAVVVVLAASAGVAVGAIPNGGEITGCYKKLGGTLRVIDATAAQCTKDETTLKWNQQGPAGPAGAEGPAGPAGPAGAEGPAGTGVLKANVEALQDVTCTPGFDCYSYKLAPGSDAIAVEPSTSGYEVTFAEDVSECTATGSPGHNRSLPGTKYHKIDVGYGVRLYPGFPEPEKLRIILTEDGFPIDSTDLRASVMVLLAC